MYVNKRRVSVIISIVLAVMALLYLGGVLGQLLTNYESWLTKDGILGQVQMEPVNWSPIVCFPATFSLNGLKGMALVTAVVGGLIIYFKLQGRFGGKDFDPRGFKTSSTGAYGTAGWMSEKEMQSVLEISSIDKAKGTILGEHRGKAVCMPEDTRPGRHSTYSLSPAMLCGLVSCLGWALGCRCCKTSLFATSSPARTST